MWKVKSTRYEASDAFRQDEAKIEERQIVESADLFDLLRICRDSDSVIYEHDDRTADLGVKTLNAPEGSTDAVRPIVGGR
jgi:hypothetical protein